MTQQFAVIAS